MKSQTGPRANEGAALPGRFVGQARNLVESEQRSALLSLSLSLFV